MAANDETKDFYNVINLSKQFRKEDAERPSNASLSMEEAQERWRTRFMLGMLQQLTMVNMRLTGLALTVQAIELHLESTSEFGMDSPESDIVYIKEMLDQLDIKEEESVAKLLAAIEEEGKAEKNVAEKEKEDDEKD